MKVEIAKGILRDTEIHIPSSKSLSHRALITAALSHGVTKITSMAENKDTQATISALQHLGVTFTKEKDALSVNNTGTLHYDGKDVDCNESGSTLRFLIPIFSLCKERVRFTGRGRLMERPQDVYVDIFSKQGLMFQQDSSGITIEGALQPRNYEVDGSISSQFITGLLCTLPLLDGDSTITVLPPYESQSYVTLTLQALQRAHIVIRQEGYTYYIPGNQTYAVDEIHVEGDDSSMAFFAVLSVLTHTPFSITNIAHDSLQGDHVILDILKNMGVKVEEIDNGYRCTCDTLRATEIDLADCPDLGPVLFALASQAEGTTTFMHIQRLRMKESDRIACMEKELHALGVDMHSTQDIAYVTGRAPIKGGVTLSGHNDHRIVMALSVLSVIAEKPVIIEGAQAVDKSYPDFFKDLEKTGVSVKYAE